MESELLNIKDLTTNKYLYMLKDLLSTNHILTVRRNVISKIS